MTSRVGQGEYRQALLDKFEGKCAVTQLGIEEVLTASHIVPWRDSNDLERLDPDNGILLSPNYDALFDQHLISFEDSGEIIVSPMIKPNQLSLLGISTEAKISVTELMKPYLARHRAKLRYH